ncbi:MAG: PAS domain-containing protein [Phycisphaeraceae bacterium]|nr:PAS domain-containing protein [Phycisphaeraceae bacterium]
MKKPKTITFIALSLASIMATLLFCAVGLGLLRDGYRERLETRARLCETIAIQFCTLLPQDQTATFDQLAPLLVHRNPDLLSLAIRDSDGQVIASTSEHSRLWQTIPSETSLETHVQIPVYADDEPSGTFEICLVPIYTHAWGRALQQMHLPLLAFCVGAGFLVFRLYLKKTLKHLDPNSVVPGRVKKVLDILSDGVVMTDEKGQIVLANEAFQMATAQSRHSLLGKNLSIFKWIDPTGHQETKDLPWIQVLQNGSTHRSVPLMLEHTNEPGQYHNTLVSATPITGAEGENRGMLVSFTDVTELERANRELVEVSRLAGKAEIATDILHNVGNILNSVNVSTTLLAEKLARSKLTKLQEVAHMITDHQNDLGHFLAKDKRGKHIPAYLIKMIDLLLHEQTGYKEIVRNLEDHIHHLSEIVNSQQCYAQTITCEVPTSLPEVVERAIAINAERLHSHSIHVVRENSKISMVTLDKSRLLQILTNLICNAIDAMEVSEVEEKKLIIRLLKPTENRLRIEVIDNGIGIAPENLDTIFQHGFTTKERGHGFGLHSSALAAKEMGGSLSAHSQGIGRGASFVYELPLEQKETVNEYGKKHEPAHSNR